ncbi:MAG: hypothetical protein J0L92_24850 [Deltaproteobacteria bacterium]|nr:hypothetical protein [Deltaproteobacteria bacterium]
MSTLRALEIVAFGLLASLVVGLVGSASASAQSRDHVVLLVRVHAPSAAAVVDEETRTAAVRDVTGAPVRRIDVTLDDLAIAADCTTPAHEAPCLARVAAAGHVGIVAIERGCGEREACTVTLHAADGTRLRALTLAEAPPPEPVASEPEPLTRSERSGTRPVVSTVVEPDTRERSRRSFRFGMHHGLYAGAIVSSFGAFVCGGLAIDAGQRWASIGVVRDSRGVDTLVALEEQRTVTLVLASAFAVTGAALAVAGWIVQGQPMPDEDDLALSLGVAPEAVALTVRGRF